MRYNDAMLIEEHQTVVKSVRVPEKIISMILEEATKRGIGKPSVLLRMLVLERIRQGNLDKLDALSGNRSELRGSPNDRFNIRFSEDTYNEVTTAAKRVGDGKMTTLVMAILIERYLQDEK